MFVEQKWWVDDADSDVTIRSARGATHFRKAREAEAEIAVEKSDGSLRSSSRTVTVSRRSDLEEQKRDRRVIVIRSAFPRLR